jgi:hypothetical protein
MGAKKSRARKPVKSLATRKLTSKQAKGVKGGGPPPPAAIVSEPLISGVGFPALDAASKDAAKMTIKYTNRFVNPKF